ncbi:DUF1525 domain-containing protein (plasmid) [Alteromonas macleodii]|uniref:Integrating conjugative element protein n=1 Tax=Alteromonas macleodii TaxID=28108 RepID=A0AB36FKX4_ALTMA|nr:DUF1525 domain-containing protein [Alteromonas macleodii]OES24331.1 hypothetical protein BFV94_4828 [Alteromonas macleodii]OES24668.1 hypothetical protein BFV95_4694 [Alteromonas macleodii]OES24936.1 hypothetical protein BFV93_4645 [Alteromonas macleodii]OES38562.1 hypothetical protein BFV96_4849 [Alteromonas macleodii]|tara:strand:- start:17443 stop:17901 length:459 start_codon:yes stop_codon:yes gene_type:complete
MNMKTMYIFCVLIFAFSANASERKVVVLFDSRIHELSNVPTFFSVEKYDVSMVGRIESEINKRLVYPNGSATSIEQVQKWAKNKIVSDPQIQALRDNLQNAYQYTKPAMQYGLSKVPAVVLVDGDNEYIVYGDTDIESALRKIRAHRVVNGG